MRFLITKRYTFAFALVLVFVLLAGAACTPAQKNNVAPLTDADVQTTTDDGVMMDKPDAVAEPRPDDSAMAEQSYSGTVLAGSASKLYDFNQTDYAQALESGKLVVLYFYATWCPVCKAEVDSALYPFFNEYAGDDVIGFRVNYNDSDTDDSETALAREFGVAYQHTKVFVKDGKRVLKSPESWDKARYNTEVANAL